MKNWTVVQPKDLEAVDPDVAIVWETAKPSRWPGLSPKTAVPPRPRPARKPKSKRFRKGDRVTYTKGGKECKGIVIGPAKNSYKMLTIGLTRSQSRAIFGKGKIRGTIDVDPKDLKRLGLGPNAKVEVPPTSPASTPEKSASRRGSVTSVGRAPEATETASQDVEPPAKRQKVAPSAMPSRTASNPEKKKPLSVGEKVNYTPTGEKTKYRVRILATPKGSKTQVKIRLKSGDARKIYGFDYSDNMEPDVDETTLTRITPTPKAKAKL